MDFDIDFKKENDGMDWTREDGEDPAVEAPSDPDTSPEKKRFDFDAFLGEESLDDRITNALDGKDLLEPDAFGATEPDYIPRRPVDGRGRHEAPQPENFTEETPVRDETAIHPEDIDREEEPMTPKLDPSDPRYAAPERPRVVVAEPKNVYVQPLREEEPYDYPQNVQPVRAGAGELVKWLIALLVGIAVIAVVLSAFFGGPLKPLVSKAVDRVTSITAREERTSEARSGDAPAVVVEEPARREEHIPAAANYSITVTAGSGGGISPSGVVSVSEGDSSTFYIWPEDGYTLSQLIVDGYGVDLTEVYTFSDVRDDHTIYAVFQREWVPEPEPEPEYYEPEPEYWEPEPLPEEEPGEDYPEIWEEEVPLEDEFIPEYAPDEDYTRDDTW